ncbi:MAG: carbohydrate ABC transporter permease [Lachnospirales bacterium]
MNKKISNLVTSISGLIVAGIVFVVPFYFIFVNSLNDRREANKLLISLPETFYFSNYIKVLTEDNGLIFTAFKNSIIITFFSVLFLVLFSSMTGYVIGRRKDKPIKFINTLLLSGLMVPSAIMPTIWVLQTLNIYGSLFSIILINISLQTPFTVMIYRGYMASVPVELEESAVIDGCSPFKVFRSIIFPLLTPVTSTVVILNSVQIFNDFTNPLYYLPGKENSTVQLTLYNYMNQFGNQYNLLFADVIIITIPMLIIFIIMNKKIIDGMVAGAVKG